MDSYVISTDLNGNEHKVLARDLEWRPTVCGVMFKEDKVLLVKDSDKYDLPGGGVELGEQPEKAIIREVKEETGLNCDNPVLLDIDNSFFTWQDEFNIDKTYNFQSIIIYFKCDYIDGEISNTFQDEYEKAHSITAEWVPTKSLDSIKIVSTFDWRPVVKGLVD